MSKIYKHYKGGLYTTILQCTHTETGEELIIYQSIESGKIYARPIDMFFSDVSVPRFTLVEQESYNTSKKE